MHFAGHLHLLRCEHSTARVAFELKTHVWVGSLQHEPLACSVDLTNNGHLNTELELACQNRSSLKEQDALVSFAQACMQH